VHAKRDRESLDLEELDARYELTDAGWLRDKVPFYAHISKPVQDMKTELFKKAPSAGTSRKVFAAREAFAYPTGAERASFAVLQKALTAETILVHANPDRALFCDLDASKARGIGAVVYHIKGDPPHEEMKKDPLSSSD
jgi:hypothetical protein